MYCVTHHMATPTTADWDKMVRLGRHLKNRPNVQLWYKFQETPCQLETYSDTDWTGCRRTCRSTTGGYTVAGSHLIKMWCKTQAVVALSSAEAELHGLVRAPAETMGLISMYKDLGTHMNGVVLGEASAALAIVARRGLGKLRHLDTHYCSVQNQFERFRGFLELISRFEFDFLRRENYFFERFEFLVCSKFNHTHHVAVHVPVLWPVCAHTIPFRMLWCLCRFTMTFKKYTCKRCCKKNMKLLWKVINIYMCA